MQNENLPQFVVTTNFRRIAGLKKRYRIVRGSAGASKTWGILALLINHCSSTANQKCIVIGRQLAKMKVGVVSDFVKLMKIFGLFRNDRWNSTTSLYTFPNDSTIQFYGTADDPMAGKGVRCNCLYADEINHIDFGAFRQFASRADVIYGSYNPDRISFVETELIPLEDCDFITVTYKGNEALGDAERSELDSYYDRAYNADGSVKSPYWENMYKVYVKGELGSIVGAIFTNIVTGEFDESLPSVYGYDMGYSDEDGLVKIAVDKKNMIIYVKELIYQNNLSNADIVKLVKEKVGNGTVVCDSAAAKTVADFKQAKIRAVSCSKRKIVDDIKDMQSYKIVITPDSPNALREFKEWCWKDRDGKSIPEDGDLHCFTSDTKIITKDGYKNIVDVNDNDYVLTRNGYEKVWKNVDNGKKMTYICDILLSNGKKIELKCTKNHKVWTENRGWRPVSKLRKGDLLRYGNSEIKNSDCIKVKDTQAVLLTQSQSDYTDMCGSASTEKYRKVMTSTTRTTIRSTTISRILKSLKNQFIYQSTSRKGCRTRNTLNGLGRKWTMQGHMHLCGINRKKEKTFTSDYVCNKLKNIKRWVLVATVTGVERNSFKHSQTTISVQQNAQMHTGLQKEENVVTTMSQGYARIAEMNSQLTNTQKSDSVQEVVRIKVRKNKTERVYDLSIDGTPEFFANGILVHNCVDPTRYGFNYLTVSQPKPSSVVVTGNRRRSGGPVISRIY